MNSSKVKEILELNNKILLLTSNRKSEYSQKREILKGIKSDISKKIDEILINEKGNS